MLLLLEVIMLVAVDFSNAKSVVFYLLSAGVTFLVCIRAGLAAIKDTSVSI